MVFFLLRYYGPTQLLGLEKKQLLARGGRGMSVREMKLAKGSVGREGKEGFWCCQGNGCGAKKKCVESGGEA
jgi:hypothetical protein